MRSQGNEEEEKEEEKEGEEGKEEEGVVRFSAPRCFDAAW